MSIRVLNRKTDDTRGAVYIGRPSPLGNPFRLQSAGGRYTRDASVDTYDGYLRERIAGRDPAVLGELSRLLEKAREGNLALECYCAPERCHGDVIKAVLEEALDGRLCWPDSGG